MYSLESTLQRLEREAKRLKEDIAKLPSIGEAVPVVLDDDVAKEHKIQGILRLVTNNGRIRLKGAPEHIDRTQTYETVERDMMDFASAWAQGKKVSVPSYMLEPCPAPTMVEESSPERGSSQVELSLFTDLSEKGHRITLINPSFSAMQQALGRNASVYLTSSEDQGWKRSIEDFVENSKGRIRIARAPRGISYLGSAQPKHYPEGDWFYLVPDPYFNHRFEMYEMKEDDRGVIFTHSRKGRMVTCALYNDSPYYIYPPQVVRANTGIPGYVLVANFPYPFLDKEVYADYVHTPWFLDDWPEMTEEGEYMVRKKGEIYYDVDGPGTYLSRRARFHAKGRWAAMHSSGPYSFDRYSTTVRVVGGVKSGVVEVDGQRQTYVAYGDDVALVVGHPAIRCDDGAYYVISDHKVKLSKVTDPDDRAGFVTVGDRAYARSQMVREGHVFVENKLRGYSGLLRGYWLPLNIIRDHNRVLFVAERINDPNMSRVIIFKDPAVRKRYYVQHVLHSQYWSRTNGSFVVDETLVGAAVKSIGDQFLDLLSTEKEISLGDVSLVLNISSDQVLSLLTKMRGQVFIVESSRQLIACKISRLSSLTRKLPGPSREGTHGGYIWADVLRDLFVIRRMTVTIEKITKEDGKECKDFVTMLRANRMSVNVVDDVDDGVTPVREVVRVRISC